MCLTLMVGLLNGFRVGFNVGSGVIGTDMSSIVGGDPVVDKAVGFPVG